MKIETKLHTVFILVGPSMCGKSTFARQFQLALDEQLHKVGVPGVVKVISSDAERQSLYSHGSLHRYSGLMSEASEAAFKVLMAKFEAAIMFPINSEFVIIDTTGMNDQFRKEVKKIADKHEYRTELVTFEYTNKSYASESTPAEKLVVDSSAARFKQKVLPNLGRKEHDGNIRIRERDPNHWFGIEVEIEDLDIYAKSHLYLPLHEELVVIGDIHEHVTAFQTLDMQLMKSRDSNATSPKEVLVGDYLDKGGNTEDTIIVIENFVEQGGIIVHGNHESYAVKRIKGEIKNPDLELEAKYMSSLKVLLKDPGLAARVVNLFDNHSVPFLKVIGRDVRTVYVTHAPCENKYLGKMSSDALKAQRNLFGRRDKDYREAYKFIFEEAVGNHPLHVFGHVAHNANKLEFRNKIFLDTGAVYGGKLTAFVYKNNRYGFYEVKTESLVEHQKELQSNLTVPINAPERPFSIYDYKLSPDDMKFLNRTLKNGIKYISGTMAPAPSTDTQIESLEAGLDYFNSRGVQFVVIEPKFMGSRCQAYLYKKDPSKSFLVSRNGFKIRMTEQLQTMLDNIPKQLDDLGFEWEDELILDGELEPWTTLGRGLVEEQFKAYEGLVHYELSTLAQDEEFNNLDFKQKIDAQGLLENDLKTFSDTLDIYAQDGEPFYSPFAILKCDGKVTNTQIELAQSFFSVSTYDALTIDVTDPEEIQLAKEFFEKVTVEKNMEGVVIKPLTLNDEIAPYMKVRNENYLTLVYGYDYKRRYEALCKQKRVGGKLKVSIKEHELAMKMLSADNGPAMTELIVKMISQLNQEKELDPRL
jgi:predicted kinase